MLVDIIIDLFNKHTHRLAYLVGIVIVVLIASSVADTTLFIVDNLNGLNVKPTNIASQPVSTDRRNQVNASIADFNLFGVVADKDPSPVSVDAPDTQLNLELEGIFMAVNNADSTAIIAQANKTGELYAVGERLPGNATLSAVFADYILIKRGSRVEKLKFSDEAYRSPVPEPNVNKRSRPTARANTRLQQSRQRIRQRQQMQNQRAPIRSTNKQASIRQAANKYKARIESDPHSVLDEFGITPVSEGEAKGYEITKNMANQAMLQAGLQPGDRILSVNGRAVGDVMNDRSMLDQVIAAGRVRIEIQRQDRRFFMSVPIPD